MRPVIRVITEEVAYLCGGKDADGSIAAHRAVVFADATADAELFDHVGHLDGDAFALSIVDLGFVEPDGFMRHGAGFFADDAGDIVCPWQAATAIHARQTYRGGLFSRQVQARNRARGADLAAGVAAVVAVAQSRHQARCEYIEDAALKEAWLQALGGAHADALTAADAQALEIGEGCAGRSKHLGGFALVDRLDTGDCHAERRRSQTREHSPSLRVVIVQRRGLPGGELPAEGDALAGAVYDAIVTDDTLGRVTAVAFARIDGSGRAIAAAQGAGSATSAHLPPHQGELGEQSQQAPERAEVATPEALSPPVESYNCDKKEEDGHDKVEVRRYIPEDGEDNTAVDCVQRIP